MADSLVLGTALALSTGPILTIGSDVTRFGRRLGDALCQQAQDRSRGRRVRRDHELAVDVIRLVGLIGVTQP